MIISVVWWDLDRSEQTIDTLREYLRDSGVAPWESVSGLRMKTWVCDRAANRWGAVELWDRPPDTASLPPATAARLIGYPPTTRLRFDVEVSVHGGQRGAVWA